MRVRQALLSWSLVVGAGALALGCSSDSKDSGNSAVAKCQLFADTWCNKALGCYSQVGRLAASEVPSQVSACKRVAEAAVPCDRAVSVSPSFDSCISAVNAMACANWDVAETDLDTVLPPSSCNQIIAVGQ